MNCVEAKQLTNIRAAGADEKVFLTPPRQFSLEEMIPYMMPDEMVEVPPRARTGGRGWLGVGPPATVYVRTQEAVEALAVCLFVCKV